VAITGDFSGDLSAGTTIGTVTVSGDASGYVYSATTRGSTGNIGAITVGTANGLTVRAGKYSVDPTLNSSGNVGNIVITGNDNNDNNQSVFVAANASADLKVGGSVGTITAKGITDNGETLEVGSIAFTTTQSVGAITVENSQAAESANLEIGLGTTATVVGIGNLSVDGDLEFLNGNFGVKTMGTIGANSINSSFMTIGAGGAGTSIGLISLATGSVGSTTFQFATMNGATLGLPAATLVVSFADVTTDIDAGQAFTNNGASNVSGGVRMNMI
jgi:mucin-19